MICKNCGYDNNDNLYICENCGSPLYDENEPIKNEAEDNGTVPVSTIDEDTEYEARKKKQNITEKYWFWLVGKRTLNPLSGSIPQQN